MTDFKGKNRDKRSSQKCKVISTPFLSQMVENKSSLNKKK